MRAGHASRTPEYIAATSAVRRARAQEMKRGTQKESPYGVGGSNTQWTNVLTPVKTWRISPFHIPRAIIPLTWAGRPAIAGALLVEARPLAQFLALRSGWKFKYRGHARRDVLERPNHHAHMGKTRPHQIWISKSI